MDLFSGSEDELTLDNLPTWEDTQPVQEWKERRQEAQAELEAAEEKLRDLRKRRRKTMSGGVFESSIERVRQRIEKGSIDERIEEARRKVGEAKVRLQDVEDEKDAAYEEGATEIKEKVEELVPEALEGYITALRQFGKAQDRLQMLDVWVKNRLRRSHGESYARSGPIDVPYALKSIPDINSPISAEQLADNLEGEANA